VKSMSLRAPHSRAVERVEGVCRGHDDPRTLRLALLEGIRGVVRFDAYSWLLTAPETEVGSAPLADVPCLSELPRLIRLKYLAPLNRWTRLDKAVAFLQADTGNQPEQSLVWRELLKQVRGARRGLLGFRDRFGCWAFLELWRNAPSRGFTEPEGEFLTAIATPITEALRRCQARTFQVRRSEPDRLGPIVLVLSGQLEVRAQTAETEKYLRILVPSDGERPAIPAGAYNVAAQLLAVEAGVDHHPPSARVHLSGGTWLTFAGGADRRNGIAFRTGRCGHYRTDVFHRSDDALHQSLRVERARGRARPSPRHGCRYSADRGRHVPLAAHGPGPPQVHLREDRRSQPTRAAHTRPGTLINVRVRRADVFRGS
jgi:hypothetical protein